MSKPAHRRGPNAAHLSPSPLVPLRTVRDQPPQVEMPATVEYKTPFVDLNSDTSLLSLFEAIVGPPPGGLRDRAAQERVVDDQIRALREELGVPEPTPSPTNVVDADTSPTPPASATVAGDATVSPPNDDRQSTWGARFRSLATRRRPQVE